MMRLVGLSISGMPARGLVARTGGMREGRTGATLGAEVPQNHNGLLTALDRPALDRREKVLLRVERARLASETEALLARYLRDGTARR